MVAKKTVVVTRPFRDREGKEHKAGEKIQVDPDYGQEIIRNGDAKEDPEASQLPADNPKAQPK